MGKKFISMLLGGVLFVVLCMTGCGSKLEGSNSIEKLINWYEGGMEGECDVIAETFRNDLYQLDFEKIGGYFYKGNYAYILSDKTLYQVKLVEGKDVEQAKLHSIIDSYSLRDDSYHIGLPDFFYYEEPPVYEAPPAPIYEEQTDAALEAQEALAEQEKSGEERRNEFEQRWQEKLQQLKENVREVFGDYATEDFEDWNYLGEYGICDVDMNRSVLKVQGTDVEFDAKVEMKNRESKEPNMFTVTWRLVINDDGWRKGEWKVCSIKPFDNN